MKIMFAKKQIIITFLTLLITTIAWGQASFSGGGSGTEADPYVLLTKADWNAFAESVNAKENPKTYEGEYLRLGNDITDIDVMVGWFTGGTFASGNEFCGNFDGDWHTLTVDIQGTADYSGPFGWVDGATIRNLTVDGTITINKSGKHGGGIVSCVEDRDSDGRPTNIINCTSKVTIVCNDNSEGGYHGGVVGWLYSGSLNFENCIFEGRMTGNTNNCAGFVGEIDNNQLTKTVCYTNCTQAYIQIANSITTFGTFHMPLSGVSPVGGWGKAYYTLRISNDGQGTRAYTSIPGNNNKILKLYEREYGDKKFYVPAAIVNLNPNDIYTEPVKPTVTYYGRELVYGTDFTTQVSNVGKSDVIVSGAQSPSVYYGSETISGINVVDITEWTDLNSLLGSGTKTRHITLKKDYTATEKDVALVVNGNVYLDLNGYTIDRNLYDPDNVGVEKGYVLSVENNTRLTINGPGVITGGNNKGTQGNGNSRGDGGGIHVVSGGNLTLNDVTIKKNKAVRSASLDLNCTFWGTGGGIYSKGTLVINDCKIIDNLADGGGGGINSQSSLTMNRTLIANNKAQSKGGGLRTSGSPVINNCCIRDNILEFMYLNPTPDDEDGGGVYLDRNTGTAKLKNCQINSNNAQWRGGGVYVNSGTAELTNCEVKYNSGLGDENNPEAGTTGGGGIYLYSGTVELNNTVITDNTSYTIGGVFVKSGKTLKIQGKTIIDDNIGDAAKPNVYLENGNGVITISGTLDEDALIGVSRAGETESSITSGLNGQNEGSNFRSDNYKMYWFVLSNKEVKLQKTKYWHTVDWNNDAYCHYDSENKTYRIDAPVIVNTKNDISKDNIVFKDSEGNPSTRAAIFIDQTKEKIGNTTVQHDGQLIYKGTPVKVTVLKNIYAAKTEGSDTYGWYTISSPVNNPNLLHNTNLITAVSQAYNFDLLRFDASNQSFPWQTYIAHPEFTNLENGIGYLYRNARAFVEESNGNMITGSVDIIVYEGWNLIGNPYTHDIVKGSGVDCAINNEKILAEGYYQLANNGGWTAETSLKDGSEIKMGEGLLVKAIESNKFIINNLAPGSKSRANDEYIQFSVANSDYEDVTYAVFNDGYGLDKINHRNPDIPMIYINQNGEDYAIATMSDEIKSFNLNFKAMKTGQYTLSCDKDGDFSYLHVIDKLTGRDIDMLLDEKYTFIGSPHDTDARFIVRLSYNGGADESDKFAYQNGDDIVVCGVGELQMFDVTGRHIMTTTINGVETIKAPSSSVYILRLLGNEIKTQKIVVR